MFDPERFIEECRAAVAVDGTHRSVREIIARAVSNPSDVTAGLGEPVHAGVQRLYNGPDLTVLNVVWGARMTVMPHNHLMWAVIGVYTGREDNIFWRRLPDAPGGTIEAAGAKSLGERDAEPLGRDHPFSNQPVVAADRRHPRLWGRLLRCSCGTQRMGSGNSARGPL